MKTTDATEDAISRPQANKDKRALYNPLEDEKKLYSNKEWAEAMQENLDQYIKDFDGQNDFHRGQHTWSEWYNAFGRYMSW